MDIVHPLVSLELERTWHHAKVSLTNLDTCIIDHHSRLTQERLKYHLKFGWSLWGKSLGMNGEILSVRICCTLPSLDAFY